MKLDTFEIKQDPNGWRYIHQVKKEKDKNHRESDFYKSNEARIYEQIGTINLSLTITQKGASLSQKWHHCYK